MMNMRNALKHILPAVMLTGLLSFSPLAVSDVLVDQPYLSEGDSFFSMVAGGFENAESFTLTADASIATITWWGTDANDVGGFLIRLGPDLGDWSAVTGSIAKTTTSGFDSEERAIYQFEQTISAGLNLTAGTHFLSISYEAEEWYWTVGSLDSTAGIAGSYFGDSEEWFEDDLNDLSFRLTSANGDENTPIPEPGILALMLIGIFMGRVSAGNRK